MEDVPVYPASDGLNYGDVGFKWDPKVATRLIRIRNFDVSKLDAFENRYMYSYTDEELMPPQGEPSREKIAALGAYSPDIEGIAGRYQKNPSAWKTGKKSELHLADPWFWVTAGRLPGELKLPLRLRASWTLHIPADGEYSFGASTSIAMTLKVNRKTVFSRIPHGSNVDANEGREGWLGSPVYLKSGDYPLDLEQVMFTSQWQFNHLIRVIWRRPGGEKETFALGIPFPRCLWQGAKAS